MSTCVRCGCFIFCTTLHLSAVSHDQWVWRGADTVLFLWAHHEGCQCDPIRDHQPTTEDQLSHSGGTHQLSLELLAVIAVASGSCYIDSIRSVHSGPNKQGFMSWLWGCFLSRGEVKHLTLWKKGEAADCADVRSSWLLRVITWASPIWKLSHSNYCHLNTNNSSHQDQNAT